MTNLVTAVGLLAGLFGAILVFVEVGRRIGTNRKVEGIGAIESAVYGLMGLLIAFTFGSAAVRFDARRSLIVEEANDIGTAYLRLDLLPEDAQPALRDAFRRYVGVRLAIYKLLPDVDAAKQELKRMTQLQDEIWDGAVAGCRRTGSTEAAMLLLPALNAMIDIATTRTVALQTHQPSIVFVMLAVVVLLSSLLAGFGMGSGAGRSRLHVVAFAAALMIAVYVILDLEYPRIGLIRIDWMDSVLEDVRRTMG